MKHKSLLCSLIMAAVTGSAIYAADAKTEEKNRKGSLLRELDIRQTGEKNKLQGRDSFCSGKCVIKKRRAELADRWAKKYHAQVVQDYEEGRYADVRLSPRWPVYGSRIPKKYLITVDTLHSYACDAYDSEGANHNIAKLSFSQSPIKVQDILLSSKLSDGVNFENNPNEGYLTALKDRELVILGKTESYGGLFRAAHYTFSKRLAVGFTIPFTYKKNRLRVLLDNAVSDFPQGTVGQGFTERYGADTQLFVKDILKAKGMNELGGSAVGLGDIRAYLQVPIDISCCEKGLVGLVFNIPTAKSTTKAKLWAPALGNGYYDFLLFFGANTRHSRRINPHLFLQADFALPVNKGFRLPRKVKVNNIAVATNPAGFAFANRIRAIGNQSISDFDTTVNGFGDVASTVKYRRGDQIQARVGNIMERMIFRRDSLDPYYEIRFKFQDLVTGLDETIYNLESVRANTKQITHMAGLAYHLQTDDNIHLRWHTEYIFAGHNVPKNFEFGFTVDFTF